MRDLLTPRATYIVEYPDAVKLTDEQVGIFWPPNEVHVEKDVQDILVNLTPAERHGVITTLKLFTQYELLVGDEYWNKVAKMFHKPACVARMANCFSFFELNVHAPFYSKINEALGLANDEFYTEYTRDPVLSERIEMLEAFANVDEDDPTSVAMFLAMLAMTEGVVLYSSFAFLKHFQSQGKNKILNIVRGINFSARDEGLHSLASSWLYRTFLEEQGLATDVFQGHIETMVNAVRDHEYKIIDKIFEKGEIEGCTAHQYRCFVDSRIDLVLQNLGHQAMFKPNYNPIGEWFYKGMNDYIANDFFTGTGREYGRNWDEAALGW